MLGKIVRFKTRTGLIREGRVKEQYVLHGRKRYALETEFGNVYIDAEQVEESAHEPLKPPVRKHK